MKLIHGDCIEEMKKMDDNSIDLCLTDPPYKTISGGSVKGLAYKYKTSILKNNDGKIFKENNINFTEWAAEVYRILKPNSHFYTMTNNLNLRNTMNYCHDIGFKFHNFLIWKKNNVLANRWYMKNCEYILFFRKGKSKAIFNMSTKQILEIDNIRNKFHPTQKPVKLMQILIENSSSDNEIILDPFMGSGSTGVACKNLNRNFIGIEKDTEYFEIAKSRIKDA
jgi:site-specific DNA-methyltransferase (adenine-specific)